MTNTRPLNPSHPSLPPQCCTINVTSVFVRRMGSINKSTKGSRVLCSVIWAQEFLGSSMATSQSLVTSPVSLWAAGTGPGLVLPALLPLFPPPFPQSCLSKGKLGNSCKCCCPAEAPMLPISLLMKSEEGVAHYDCALSLLQPQPLPLLCSLYCRPKGLHPSPV